MNRSDSIKELASALAKAQGQMRGAIKDAKNPHFRNDYATLASICDAVRDPLAAHGLSYVQVLTDGDGGDRCTVETVLMHASGEWLGGTFSLPVSKADAQGFGSAATYARRYALAAMVGVAPADDDGNLAAAAKPSEQARPLNDAQLTALQELRDAALNGTEALKAAWGAVTTEARHALRNELAGLKAAAVAAEKRAA